MPVYVLLRASNKTGVVDTCMTGITSALMGICALSNAQR